MTHPCCSEGKCLHLWLYPLTGAIKHSVAGRNRSFICLSRAGPGALVASVISRVTRIPNTPATSHVIPSGLLGTHLLTNTEVLIRSRRKMARSVLGKRTREAVDSPDGKFYSFDAHHG